MIKLGPAELYISLHTADPGLDDTDKTRPIFECRYPGYARPRVMAWHREGEVLVNSEVVFFPRCLFLSDTESEVATFIGISTGAKSSDFILADRLINSTTICRGLQPAFGVGDINIPVVDEASIRRSKVVNLDWAKIIRATK